MAGFQLSTEALFHFTRTMTPPTNAEFHPAWSERFVRLAGSAVDFPYPEEPQVVERNEGLRLEDVRG